MDEAAIKRILCDLLGVSADASPEAIHEAYSKKVKEWHPDRVNHNKELAALAEQKLKDINQANECLEDRKQFEMYGEKLAKKLTKETVPAAKVAASAKANPQHAHSGASSAASSSSCANAGGAGKASDPAPGKKAQAKSNNPENMRILIVLVIVLVVLWFLNDAGVFNESHRSSSGPSSSGIVPNPSDAPGAPVRMPQQPTEIRLAPDTSVGAPPN